MYLDSEGLVTVGCGTMLPTAQAASAIPFYHDSSRQAATSSEVEATWRALAAGRDAQKTAAPKSKHIAKYYKDQSDLRITRPTLNNLLDAHLDADEIHLKLIYPKFEEFPDDAKVALFDMIYNLGLGHGKARHHRATGLMGYPTMNRAINSGDWAAAAKDCTRHGIQAQRNLETAKLFKNCATAQNGRMP
ncbi:hypothetical protein [Nitrospirillum viridazoti]|uniref:Lysozyme n=1 Tax=Nitrospirillum viridazoti CBAmc TaxID=1441467 RepID=A0A248JP68_9PROT|nr:hypothetical protein [Nitrospirillum amazonense]ASG20533.1 hypothetical protein Y958_06690 [Nitrospirillum amazonense CBAmc]